MPYLMPSQAQKHVKDNELWLFWIRSDGLHCSTVIERRLRFLLLRATGVSSPGSAGPLRVEKTGCLAWLADGSLLLWWDGAT